MSKAIFLQHAAHIGPGRIVPLLRDFGIATEVRHVYRGDEVPTDLDELRVLVVLGGQMSVADAGDAKFAFLAAELELLKRMVHHDRPVLGIGLGAQLLAAAAGARVYPNVKMAPPASPGQPPQPAEPLTPLPEFGWMPVQFPFPGGTEPMVMGMHDGALMFHWHFDTFDLPRLPPPGNPPTPPAPPPPTGNSLLSSTKLCRNQAFRFKNRLFGFQYHFECTPEGIEAMLMGGKAELARAGVDEASVRQQTAAALPAYLRLGDRLLRNFVQFLKVYAE
jgi:GMP synthase (glutamine-hydrolysing)